MWRLVNEKNVFSIVLKPTEEELAPQIPDLKEGAEKRRTTHCLVTKTVLLSYLKMKNYFN